MKRLYIVPDGMPDTLDALPQGLFVTVDEPFAVGIKDEYYGHGYTEAGEYWCGKRLLMPCHIEVEEGL